MKKILLTILLIITAFTLADSQVSINLKPVVVTPNYAAEKLDSVQYLPPIPLPEPRPIPWPWPGPLCLSCPPFPLDKLDKDILTIDQLQIPEQLPIKQQNLLR